MTKIRYQYLFYVLGAIDVALGAAATGVFSTSDSLWNSLHQVVVKAKLSEYNVIVINSNMNRKEWVFQVKSMR